MVRISSRRGVAGYRVIVDLNGTVNTLGLRVSTAELYITIDLRSGHGNLLARSGGAAVLRPYKCACRTFGGNITVIAQKPCLQLGVLTNDAQLRIAVRMDAVIHPEAVLHAGQRHGDVPQLAARAPGVGAFAVVQGISDGVIGNGFTIVGRQLVLPDGVAVAVGNGLLCRSQCSGGVGVLHLAGDVAAAVVVVDPSMRTEKSLFQIFSEFFF